MTDQPDTDAPPPSRGAELAAEAVETLDAASIEEQIAALPPEEAAMFARILEITLARRRVMLIGYILALVTIVVGTFFALYVIGRYGPDVFLLWVLLVPVALTGAVLYGFGRWSKRIGTRQPLPDPPSRDRA
jgi:hypothetical protein